MSKLNKYEARIPKPPRTKPRKTWTAIFQGQALPGGWNVIFDEMAIDEPIKTIPQLLTALKTRHETITAEKSKRHAARAARAAHERAYGAVW
jgi:hypothetical protein